MDDCMTRRILSKTFAVGGILLAMLASSGCSMLVPGPEPRVYQARSGAFDCRIPWLSSELQVVEERKEGFERVSFMVPRGSIHRLDSIVPGSGEVGQVNHQGPPLRQLELLFRDIEQVWIAPEADTFRLLSSRQTTVNQRAALLRIYSVSVDEQEQYRGYLALMAQGRVNVFQYMHPRIWDETIIVEALQTFAEGCRFGK
jgi:hypothetical protein